MKRKHPLEHIPVLPPEKSVGAWSKHRLQDTFEPLGEYKNGDGEIISMFASIFDSQPGGMEVTLVNLNKPVRYEEDPNIIRWKTLGSVKFKDGGAQAKIDPELLELVEPDKRDSVLQIKSIGVNDYKLEKIMNALEEKGKILVATDKFLKDQSNKIPEKLADRFLSPENKNIDKDDDESSFEKLGDSPQSGNADIDRMRQLAGLRNANK